MGINQTNPLGILSQVTDACGDRLNKCLNGIGIPMLKIRRSRDRLIFNMGIPYLEKTVFILRWGPDLQRRVAEIWKWWSSASRISSNMIAEAACYQAM